MTFLQYIKKYDRNITLITYLLPILLSVIVSLAHVVVFWDIANPLSWAIFLSIAVEIGVLSSLAGSRISNSVWLPFSLVTLIQIVGNIFYSYVDISPKDPLFLSWVELSDPFFNFIGLGTDGDLVIHRRIVATFLGSFVPLMSILFFRFFIRTVRQPVTAPAPEPTPVPIDETKNTIPMEKDYHLPSPDFTKAPPSIEVLSPEEPIKEEAPEWYKSVDFAKLKALPPEVMKEIVEEAQKPSPATEAIKNMTKIDPVKIREPYTVDINNLPQMGIVDVPNIELEDFEPPFVTDAELPMIAADLPAEEPVVVPPVEEPVIEPVVEPVAEPVVEETQQVVTSDEDEKKK